MSDPKIGHFFQGIPDSLPEELFERLNSEGGVEIERIVSKGHHSPEGFWYDQARTEWVILLQGSARIEFEGTSEAVSLKAGDYLEIPAHCRHRVDWTSEEPPAVWLAVHY